MKFLIETPRLKLRELNAGDAPKFFELNNDPEVIKYTGDPPFENVEAAREFLKNYDQYKKYGYGRWAVIEKRNGEFLGWCGLKFLPEQGETDLGFRFYRKHWNKGYATEAAIACVEIGFKNLALKKIVGRAMAANEASIAVLKKAGFALEKEIEFGGQPGLLFKLDAPAKATTGPRP